MSLVEGEAAPTMTVVADVGAVEQSPPLTSAQLAQQELDARSSLAQVALDREATFSKALTFMHACHASLYACLEELNRLNTSKETNEETLIRAETHACTVVDVVARAEDTRRFLVNRVRCAAWERKSHFHLTAIDHMLGNTQPALFDVASMLRGHLQICAMARSAMEAQTNRQFEIQAQLEIKEKAFKHVKELLESMEEQKSRSEEYKQILRDLKHKIGRDLERFIERKSRNKRLSTPASIQSPVESISSNASSVAGLADPSSSMGRLHTRSVSTFHASTLDASLANELRALNLAALDTPMSDSVSHSSQLTPSPTSPATPRLTNIDQGDTSAAPPPKTSPHSPEKHTTMNASSPHSLSPPSSGSSPMMSWPLPTAPQPTSLLVSSLAVADCWPDEELASSHIETLTHPVAHGHSSHAEPDHTLASADALSPPVTPPPLNAFGSFSTAISASPGASPATAIVTSPPRQQIAQFIKADATPSSSLASSASGQSVGSSTPTHRSSSHSQENHERASDRSPSPSSANKSPTTSRQGYLNIKMRYFQSLGQGRSPPQSPRPAQTTTSSFAAALALAAGGATRRNSVEPNAAAAPGLPPIPSFPSPTDTYSASSSASPASPVADATSPTLPASPPALPSIRSRAMLSATNEGDATQHKRWMLRPLPANISASKESVEEENERKAREMPELGPLLDSNVHDPSHSPSGSTSPSAPSSPTPASSAASSAPPRKSWWAALFSPRVKSPAELEKEREKEREKEAQRQKKEAIRAAEKAAKEAEKERKRLEKEVKKGVSQPPIVRSFSSPEASTTVTSPSATSEPSSASVVMSSEVSASPEVAASSGSARLLSSEWKELQGLYDEIEALASRQQENWERLELILDKRERVRAEERQRQAEEEKRAKEEAIQKEKERQEAAAAAAAAAAALAEAASSTRLDSSSSTVPTSSSFTKVPSSHATVRSNASSPTPSSSGSGSSTPILAPNAERPARKSVLSLLQSVPAPTLAPAPIPPLISIPPALATAFRNAVLDHLSRSTPSTPPPTMGSEHNQHHHHHASFGGHGRRASDSQARPASAGSSPRSAPAGRSNSFSYAASSQQNASNNQQDPLDIEYAEQRARYAQQHRDSPPSPSSLVF